jgi:Holliday junction resolvase
MNSIYKQGRAKEYMLCKKLREEGFDIVFRSAGSHSPIDIVAININDRVIKLIQSKRVLSQTMNTVNEQLKAKLEKEFSNLNAIFNVYFNVM